MPSLARSKHLHESKWTGIWRWRWLPLLPLLFRVRTISAAQTPPNNPEPLDDGDDVDDLPLEHYLKGGNTIDHSLLAPFDTDIRKDCRSILIHCQSEVFSHVYLQCPALCTKYLEQEGMKGTAPEGQADTLWEVGTFRTYQGKRIDSDRFEGYVTVVCILPLLPGMAYYYYEMMYVLHAYFSPKVEFVMIPIDVGEGLHIKLHNPPNVVVLEEESAIETHPWVRYLTSIVPRSGAASQNHRDEIVQVELQTDRLNVYIVSSDGYFFERLTVPTMATLQKRIAIYLKTMDYEL